MTNLNYPGSAKERNRWIVARRGAKNSLDPWRPYAYFWEEEIDSQGEPVPTATLLLTNRECPYRCVMCDLWQNTLDEQVPVGAIPAQISFALDRLPPARQIKLYNAGSFFDPNAIPPEDHAAIAERVSGFERVVVECHPALIGARCLPFRDRLAGKLEIAMGLETAHAPTLKRLNKRITVESFQRAAAFLAAHQIELRVFLLVRPPFQTEQEGLFWAKRSVDVAIASGATVICLIPTRGGNGAMEALATSGDYTPPRLQTLEAAVEYGLQHSRCRIFADLWDIERFHTCDCSAARSARLAVMNDTQRIPASVRCDRCSLEE